MKLLGSPTKTKVFRTSIIAAVSLYDLLLLPYYPILVAAVIAMAVAITSLKYPTGALAAGLILSILPAYYQNTFFGVIYAGICLFVLVMNRSWPTLFLAALGWAVAMSPISILAFVPVIIVGLFLGAKDAAKLGVALGISFFLLGWLNGMMRISLVLVPFPAAVAALQPIPDPWLPFSFLYSSRGPSPSVSAQLQATLIRNFVADVTFYVEAASWGLAGYITGMLASRWRWAYPWIVAAAVGFVPMAAAYAYGSSFHLPTANLDMLFGIVAAVVVASPLQFARSNLATIMGLLPSISTGYDDLDRLLAGGLPEGYAVLMLSESSDERDLILRKAVNFNVSLSRSVFYASSNLNTTQELLRMHTRDFYAFSALADKIEAGHNNLFKIQDIGNLSELNILFSTSVKNTRVNPKASKLLILDIVSDILLRHKALMTYRWLTDFLARRKSEGFTILATLNASIASKEETQTINDLFDGIIEIFDKQIGERTRRYMVIRKMRGRKYLDTDWFIDKAKLF